VVYIDEAHPTNLWQTQSNLKEGVVFQNPASANERAQVASACVRKLHIAIPALIDSMENHVEKDYTGWPDRLYLIDSKGHVAYKSLAGPFGFDPAKLAQAIRTGL
jgi:hypothetical protein